MSSLLRRPLLYRRNTGEQNPFAGTLLVRVDTTQPGTPNNQFNIPVQGSGNNFDTIAQLTTGGTIDTTTGNLGSTTLTFTDGPGEYYVGISGTFRGFSYNNGGDRLKLREVLSWGSNIGLQNAQVGAFYGCENLIAIPEGFDAAFNLFNGANMFRGAGLTVLHNDLVLDNVRNCSGMFQNNFSLSVVPASVLLSLMDNGFAMWQNCPLTTDSWSSLLVRVEANNSNTGVQFYANLAQRNAAGTVAHDALESRVPPWDIVDAGPA